MRKLKKQTGDKDAGSMLTQKTNEDYNKKKPDPSNPNEVRGAIKRKLPKIGYAELKRIESKVISENPLN